MEESRAGKRKGAKGVGRDKKRRLYERVGVAYNGILPTRMDTTEERKGERGARDV
jgi:hypothetical protein